ncbi:unnamed protein product [Echinostoma caproni]|uniref:Exonuclease domain-containing protein n=1 Tax=Echinostoma caproni TaxID=27848 RepID=A0A3P8GJA9_9TREM|nr:unnamed protein product [Echinostoma caproni]
MFHQKVFDSNAADLIQSFLKQLDPPVCLVAQNGYKFDYPLLRTELASVCGAACKLLDSTGSPILCSDSLHLFKALLKPFQTSLNDSGLGCSMDSSSSSSQSIPSGPLAQSSPRKPDQEVSWHLGDIYARVFGTSHKYAHNAEGDSLAILELIQHIGFPAFDWLQVNYREFNSFHFMYPPIAYAEIDTNPPKSQTILTDTASQLENIKLH